MNWVTFIRQYGQRPQAWWQVGTPSFWQQANRERQATVKTDKQRLPCGHCVTTQFVAPTGEVVRQDIAITVGREALTR